MVLCSANRVYEIHPLVVITLARNWEVNGSNPTGGKKFKGPKMDIDFTNFLFGVLSSYVLYWIESDNGKTHLGLTRKTSNEELGGLNTL